jgi:MFS family permease
MVTLLMGGATFLIGCVPSYETIGFMAPVLVLILRMLQGLALGEYGAATYGSTPRRTKRILDFLDSNNSNCRFIHFIDGDFGHKKHS